jgi:hypothetical protein
MFRFEAKHAKLALFATTLHDINKITGPRMSNNTVIFYIYNLIPGKKKTFRFLYPHYNKRIEKICLTTWNRLLTTHQMLSVSADYAGKHLEKELPHFQEPVLPASQMIFVFLLA